MVERLDGLVPEMMLLALAVVVAVLGLSKASSIRRAVPLLTAGGLFVAAWLAWGGKELPPESAGFLAPSLAASLRTMIAAVGGVLALVASGTVDRRLEHDVESGRMPFEPLRASRGEFYAFMLLSITGAMLVASASDLIWLFLALELTSLPTYVMVVMGRSGRRGAEASVKYFFLGAMATAIFLYGFALVYGGTGSMQLADIAEIVASRRNLEGLDMVTTAGFLLALLGVGYKLAAAPLHLYAMDVYEGASASVTAFLGFVPKAAGTIAFMVLLQTAGGESLPAMVVTLVWMLAVLTMSLGNMAALQQTSAKRLFGGSSIAHSGYLLIGLLAGPGEGWAATTFYLLVYGLMNTGVFAVLAALERRGSEVEQVSDLGALRHHHPGLGWSLVACSGSLMGFPPLLGFVAKVWLFLAAVQSGHIALVVIAAINSAAGAWYYLRMMGMPLLGAAPSEPVEAAPSPWPARVAMVIGVLLLVVPFFADDLMMQTREAAAAAVMVLGN